MEHNDNYIFNSQLALPYLESDEKVVGKIFKTLSDGFNLIPHSQQRFIDLGAGDGTVIIHCALNYDIVSVGVEIKPSLIEDLRARIERIKTAKKGLNSRLRKIKVIQGDIFQQDLGTYDFVYIFSLPTMQRFLNHVFQTAKKGTIFVSYKYPLDEFSYLEEKHQINTEIKDKEISAYFYKKKTTNS
jgi:16S rRNA G527 N7-methylase RsmG